MPEEILEKRPQQSNKSLMWIIAVLLILVIAAGAYILVNRDTAAKNESSTEQLVEAEDSATDVDSSATADEIANWKTYTNDTYGFSFKYPSDWVERSGVNGELTWIDSSAELNASTRISVSRLSTLNDFIKSWSVNNNPQTLDELISALGSKVSDVTISNVNSTEFLEGALGGNNLDVVIPKENNLIFFQFIGRDYSSLNPTENQILSTFQFTKY